MPPTERFLGAGIYAIYYTGSFPAYRAIASANAQGEFLWPIYVGKAVPEGARTGSRAANATYKLHGRLKQHAKSVEQAENLDIEDFRCRYLVVDDIWIPLGESLLIDRYKPLWNTMLDGFGIHDPGSGRGMQRCSSWDTLHHGRSWIAGLPCNDLSSDELASSVKASLDATWANLSGMLKGLLLP